LLVQLRHQLRQILSLINMRLDTVIVTARHIKPFDLEVLRQHLLRIQQERLATQFPQ
jgi:hypothetical protein